MSRFLILALDPQLSVTQAQTSKGVVTFLIIGHFFIEETPLKTNSKNFFMICNFLIGPLAEAVRSWPGL